MDFCQRPFPLVPKPCRDVAAGIFGADLLVTLLGGEVDGVFRSFGAYDRRLLDVHRARDINIAGASSIECLPDCMRVVPAREGVDITRLLVDHAAVEIPRLEQLIQQPQAAIQLIVGCGLTHAKLFYQTHGPLDHFSSGRLAAENIRHGD